MVDVPLWMMGLMCLLLIGLVLLLVVRLVIRASAPNRRLTDVEKDYDEGPRDGER